MPSAVVDPSAVIDPTRCHRPARGDRRAGADRRALLDRSGLRDPGRRDASAPIRGCVANVTLCNSVVLGERCLLHPGVVIGADGFGLAPADGEWLKVPQVGGVRIGNDVEIGANTTIDRGAIDDTVIERRRQAR